MQKIRAIVYQRVYVCTLKSANAQENHIRSLAQYISQTHDGLTGVLMQGESAIVGLVEGDQARVNEFILTAHPEPIWLSHDLMTQVASHTRLYPKLELRLRTACAMPELMAFVTDLRRSSKHDVTWHADSQTLTSWLDPDANQFLEKGQNAF